MCGAKRSAEEAGLEAGGSPGKRVCEQTVRTVCADNSYCNHHCYSCKRDMPDVCEDTGRGETWDSCEGDCLGSNVCMDCMSPTEPDYCKTCVKAGHKADYDESEEDDYDEDSTEPSPTTKQKYSWAIVKAACSLCWEYGSGAPCAGPNHTGHVCICCIGDVRGTRTNPQPVCMDCVDDDE